MAAQMAVRWDVKQIMNVVFNAFGAGKRQISTATCDGLILKMHYRWTFFALFANFLMVWYQWYHRDVITCVSQFNAENSVRMDYLNTCLSYPFLVKEDFHHQENGEYRNFIVGKVGNKGEESRRYILFYRWVSWSFLLLAGMYYIPRKVSKSFENPRTKELIELIARNAFKLDNTEQQVSDITIRYIHLNMRTHNGLYYKYIVANFVALCVDIFAFVFLDFLLQGRFIRLGFNAFPYRRDPVDFSDYISQTFPPFAECDIDNTKMLMGKGRHERFGCHLTFMELYEKFFITLWFWLILLTTVTACYIVYLLFLHLPFLQRHVLRIAKPAIGGEKIRDIVPAMCLNCKVGDVFLLQRIKSHLTHLQFYRMMVTLSKPDLFKKPERPEVKSPPGVSNDTKIVMNHNPELRHRNNVGPNQVNELINLLDGNKHHIPNGHPNQATNHHPQGSQGGAPGQVDPRLIQHLQNSNNHHLQGPQGGAPRQQQQPRPQTLNLPQNIRPGQVDPRLIQHLQNSNNHQQHTAVLLESDD